MAADAGVDVEQFEDVAHTAAVYALNHLNAYRWALQRIEAEANAIISLSNGEE